MAVASHRLNGTGSCAPQIMEDITGTYRYGALIRLSGDVTIFRQTLATGAISTYDMLTDAAACLAMDFPFVASTGTIDDHYALAIGVDQQGRIWLAGNVHADPLRFIRSDGAWPPVWTVPAYPFTATDTTRSTYQYFTRTADHKLLWFSDQQDTASTRGRDILGHYLPTGAGTTWSKILGSSGNAEIMSTTATSPTGVQADRVYVVGALVTPAEHGRPERLHIAGIWRTGDSDANTQKQPFYIYTDASNIGVTNAAWYTITGVNQPMPITWTNRVASATITSAPTLNRNFSTGLAIDKDGYPHIVVQNGGTLQGPTGTPPDVGPAGAPVGDIPGMSTRVRCYWDGSAWQVANLKAQAIGSCSGPPIVRVRSDLYMLSTSASFRQRVTNDKGHLTDSIEFWLGKAPIPSGMENNPDPIALKRGELALMIADGDTPEVHTFGNHARFIAG